MAHSMAASRAAVQDHMHPRALTATSCAGPTVCQDSTVRNGSQGPHVQRRTMTSPARLPSSSISCRRAAAREQQKTEINPERECLPVTRSAGGRLQAGSKGWVRGRRNRRRGAEQRLRVPQFAINTATASSATMQRREGGSRSRRLSVCSHTWFCPRIASSAAQRHTGLAHQLEAQEQTYGPRCRPCQQHQPGWLPAQRGAATGSMPQLPACLRAAAPAAHTPCKQSHCVRDELDKH